MKVNVIQRWTVINSKVSNLIACCLKKSKYINLEILVFIISNKLVLPEVDIHIFLYFVNI